jgi:tRNA threonylcarbamoyladenosine biosynthesis protein TsaE
MDSTSLDESLALAARIGAKLKGGEVIELISDLGGGKTAFVKGIAQGAGSSDIVSSPSFTLTNQYQAGLKTIHHFDFYRLNEPGILKDEIAEIISDRQNVTIIEWADLISDTLPDERLRIEIRVTGETSRNFKISCPDSLGYLID